MDDKKNAAKLGKDIKEFIAHGSKESFEKIYNHYFDKIYRFVFLKIYDRHIAEDISSEVFFTAYRSMGKTNLNYYSFNAWIYKIAANKTIDYLRKNKKFIEESLSDEQSEININLTENEEKIFSESSFYLKKEFGFNNENLYKALNMLPDSQKNVVLLKFVEDLDYRYIAAILDKKEPAVRALVFRAMINIKNIYQKLTDGDKIKDE